MRIIFIASIALLILGLICYIKRDHIIPDISDAERERYNIYNVIEKISLIIGSIGVLAYFILF